MRDVDATKRTSPCRWNKSRRAISIISYFCIVCAALEPFLWVNELGFLGRQQKLDELVGSCFITRLLMPSGFNPVSPRHALRLDWRKLSVISPLGKLIEETQSLRPCHTTDTISFTCQRNLKWKKHVMTWSGLGSSLHVWSQELCHAMENNLIMLTRGPWLWLDKEKCSTSDQTSPLQCYFGGHESLVSSSLPSILQSNNIRTEQQDPYFVYESSQEQFGACNVSNLMHRPTPTTADFRAASMEWLFQSVNPIVIEEAQRQILLAFGPQGLPPPEHMITVNIRWGDKRREMELQPISRYIDAVQTLLLNKQAESSDSATIDHSPVHIYLASEDPVAIKEFRAKAPCHWNIHVSGPTNAAGNPNMMDGENANGRNGLESLGALLLSLESNGFVLTTASNWSRLINELRKNVVDPRCGNCTRMVDLLHGEW